MKTSPICLATLLAVVGCRTASPNGTDASDVMSARTAADAPDSRYLVATDRTSHRWETNFSPEYCTGDLHETPYGSLDGDFAAMYCAGSIRGMNEPVWVVRYYSTRIKDQTTRSAFAATKTPQGSGLEYLAQFQVSSVDDEDSDRDILSWSAIRLTVDTASSKLVNGNNYYTGTISPGDNLQTVEIIDCKTNRQACKPSVTMRFYYGGK